MKGIHVYAADYDAKLPYGPRLWPHMSMLDVWELMLTSYSAGLQGLHCPADPYDPGWTAWWWKANMGYTMNATDHLQQPLPVHIDPEVDYSYYWYVKMYLDVTLYGEPDLGSGRQWTMDDVKYPSNLIALTCFAGTHGSEEDPGNQAGFADAHAEWVPTSKLLLAGANGRMGINLDWTMGGIAGKDVD